MSDFSPDERIARLEEIFAMLPGLGPRSASRLVATLLTEKKETARSLLKELHETLSLVHHCPHCHTLTTEKLCAFCSDTTRDKSRICVVESVADQRAIEESVAYRGSYFVLAGRVNPLEGTVPDALGVPQLLKRIGAEEVQEVILATSFTPEGELTAHLIASRISKHAPGVRLTRLSKGLPTGVEIEYADPASIASGLIGRR